MTRTARPWVNAGLPPDAYDALADGSARVAALVAVARGRRSARGRPPAGRSRRAMGSRPLRAAGARRSAEPRRSRSASAGGRLRVRIDRAVARRPAGRLLHHGAREPEQGAVGAPRHRSRRPIRPTSWRSNVRAGCAAIAATVVRLATSHRCVRAQEIPKRRGFTANFRIFCLASAGLERQNHAFVVEAVVEHMTIMLRGAGSSSSSTASRSPIGASPCWPPKNAPRSVTASSRCSDGRSAPSPPRASVLQRRLALSDRGAFERRHRDSAHRRRRVRLGGEAHVQPQGRLRRERPRIAARAAAVSTPGKSSSSGPGAIDDSASFIIRTTQGPIQFQP